ncbi:MAG: ThiF family adenylyltransferase, partial [Dehalococcoidia bacterium]|nr:ThiF family adenylyltransferase [Dehalococcoidia bacterium]
MSIEDRYSRQASVVPEDVLSQHRVTVIGVGAIGRQVALQVTAIGVPWVQLIDFDIVDEVNLPIQGFRQAEVGQGKVFAVASAMEELGTGAKIITVPKPFKASQLAEFGNVVFCCVDDIEIRGKIWKDVQGVVDVFIDGRMTAESLRVISVTDEESREYYPTTLFKSEEAYQ